MEKALVISLNFNPGHVSHMVASYRQLEELGYESLFYVNEAFIPYLPKSCRYSVYSNDKVPEVSIALVLFPSQKNLFLIRKLKRLGSKVIYIFHEPLAPLKEYRKAGFSYTYLAKLWIVNQISRFTMKWSDAVLLPSKKALKYYEANPLYSNKNFHYLPLLFDDERTSKYFDYPRYYFGYIGTVAADHSFMEYMKFAEWAILEKRLPLLKFLIATKSDFDIPRVLAESSRVVIKKGAPLSNDEINACYASTLIVWNAYSRTTQSGVLAKSFMFGTPAIVLRKNLSEFTEDGKEVVAISDNTSFEEIQEAVLRIMASFDTYSSFARERFEKSFYYKQYNESFREILASL
jgi:hypothetical protein